jgi:16S rRNA (uracil1498-N3)-methyltransferase
MEIYMHHFFAKQENIYDDHIIIDGSDVNHIKNVLRLKAGDRLLVSCDANVDYYCTVVSLGEDEVRLGIDSVDEEGRELPSRIYLFQGLPKGDKMEFIIQKAVELGAYEIIPVAMKRSVVRFDQKKEQAKLKRWNAIAESAAKQSKRSHIPEVKPCMDFKAAVEYAKSLDVRLLPYECAEGMQATKELVARIQPGQSIGVFIGPEGGFDGGELELAASAGCDVITLGKRILRTETAGLMVLSVLMYHLED